MVLKYQKWYKILELLFEHPNQEFTIREIAKKTRIPAMSVQRYLSVLRKAGIIQPDLSLGYTPYICFLKSQYMIDKMYTSGLISYLTNLLMPSVIILFGSIRKGEYDHESDIDIFVETHKKIDDIDLHIFEKKLKHRIDLFIERSITNFPENLRNNVINGIKLQGFLTLNDAVGKVQEVHPKCRN